MESARDILARRACRARDLGGEAEGHYPPLAVEIRILITEGDSGSYVADVEMSRAFYEPQSGEVTLGAREGMDGIDKDLRDMREVSADAVEEVWYRMFG